MLLPHKNVEIENNISFENFVGQFQQGCSKLLCIVDGVHMCYYDKMGEIPNNIKFFKKEKYKSITEYYFKSLDDNTQYCVFGRDAASTFYPAINLVDPLSTTIGSNIFNISMPLFHEKTQRAQKKITIIDNGIESEFIEYNYAVEVVVRDK